MKLFKITMILFLFICYHQNLFAATYYVDYQDGKDSSSGLKPRSAWKHAPGDGNAGGKPAATKLRPGDRLLFRGGVVYHGSLRLNQSGTKEKPIVLDANMEGSFGEGPAILDGAQVINNWMQCKNAAEAGGNPGWKKIFYADVTLDISKNFTHGEVVSHRQVPRDKMAPWQRVILCDGERRLLPISQYPKPSDDFYPDIPSDFLISAGRIETDKSSGLSFITDSNIFGKEDDSYFKDMFIGLHGGNNHVYFSSIQKSDPNTGKVYFPNFKYKTYPKTKYALYNSVRLIANKGEWAIQPIGNGRSRIYLMPDKIRNGMPTNIGFPVLDTGIRISDGASYVTVDGFVIQRFAGGSGAVAIERSRSRSKGIVVSNCEMRFLTGHAGVAPSHCDGIIIDNCYIHHCPGWTTAIFLSRSNDYVIRNCLLDKNSGSGIRHYESKRGRIHDNRIINHYGIHSSTINMYEGCEDILLENNYLHNVIAINRSAKNLIIRNNVLDSQGKAPYNVAIWQSGRTGGTDISNITIENNTFLNLSKSLTWGATIFIQSGKRKPPTGVMVRNNIIDKLQSPSHGSYANNIFIQGTNVQGFKDDSLVVNSLDKLFVNHKIGDYRRKKRGPQMVAGADVPPLSTKWQRD